MVSGTSDVVMTPDLRLSVKQPGALDLRIRVTPNGDTCVENRVAQTEAKTIAQAKEEAQILDQGPTLTVVNLFGDESYEVRPGQRVLFEHANLREVVDHESSPCGCPGEIPTVVSDAGTLSLLPGDKMSPEQAAALHPFPAAVSQGLAPAPSAPFPPPPPPGTAQVQVATSLTYAGDGSGSNAAPAAAASTPTGGPVVQAPKQQDGFFHRLGRFFKRIL